MWSRVQACARCGNPERFTQVTDLGSWEDALSEDPAIEAHIRHGAFVPINIGGDGAFQVMIRQGPRNARETQYTLVSSDPYLLVSQGTLMLGGLENVGSYVGDAQAIPCAPGRYAVTIHLLDRQAEPGSTDDDGDPTETALPDFLVEVHPAPEDLVSFRSSVQTFERSG